MRKSRLITRAVRLGRRRRYDDAIKLLEAEDNREAGSFTCKYTLGALYLRTGVMGRAFSYFREAQEQKTRDPLVLLGMAVMYLNRGDTARAVDFYLEVLEMDERNGIARKALKVIRKYAGTDGLGAWIESGAIRSLFPPLPRVSPSPGAVLLPIALTLCAVAGAGLFLVKTGRVSLPVPAGARAGAENLALVRADMEAPMQTGGSYRYVLTKDEVTRLYNEARTLFLKRYDQAARAALNRVLDSNAPEGIKNKASLIISYIEEDPPGFDTLKDRVSYAEAAADPMLYRDCYVIWRGRAANLEAAQTSTSFDLLVGYDQGGNIEGIVRVVFNDARPVNLERPLEVLGRVKPTPTEQGILLRLEGRSLNQAGFKAQ